MKLYNFIPAFCFCMLLFACGRRSGGSGGKTIGDTASVTGDTLKKGHTDRAGTVTGADAGIAGVGTNAVVVVDTVRDEKVFDKFFEKFKKAVRLNNEDTLRKMLYFPFQTSPKWENEDVQGSPEYRNVNLVHGNDFHKSYKNIFYDDVRRILPLAKDEDITEYKDDNGEDYYKTLRSLTDKGSVMYDFYAQFALPKQKEKEGFFGFVFGKVHGEYKAISFYSRFPAIDSRDPN